MINYCEYSLQGGSDLLPFTINSSLAMLTSLKAGLVHILLWPFIVSKVVQKGEVSRTSGSTAVLRDQRGP